MDFARRSLPGIDLASRAANACLSMTSPASEEGKRRAAASHATAPNQTALTSDQLRGFLRAEVMRTPRVVREWLGAERLERHLTTWITRHLVAHGHRSEAYVISTPRGAALACRAESQKHGAKPLVEVIALAFLPNDRAELGELARAALDGVPGDHDDKVRLIWWHDAPWQPDRVEPGHAADAAGPTIKIGKSLFSMPIERIVELPPPAGRERVRMSLATDLDFYDEYARHYQAWMEASPHLADFVRVETREDMQAFLDEGLLALAEFDGAHGWELGGVMAARGGKSMLGLGGVQTAEEFIYPAFRGQGLAAPMQRAYVDLLATQGYGVDGGCVIGWIHHINEASRRTALKVGRHELARQVLVRP